ncbi:hypothetical protein CLV91_0571 [Maribacter vaceletii]|uniref:Lipoprotein n=1 Tax=Maribacter vaceletii TaxID=1206816 RepID=A0A495EC83_9FLAO|nr:hypothetical protein [Maribacter vaceletii]RKR14494.1 hypothetical protein CLV91_0571 [Maribacter vaceletii]
MRYLLSSICFFVMVSCSSYPKKNGFTESNVSVSQVYNPYFSNAAKDYVYKADLQFYKKKFSGIIIIKKITDKEHRLVFTTEMGNKIFDFSFYQNTFKVNHVLEEMNKKIILNVLERDFTTLVKEFNVSTQTYTKENLEVKEAEVLNKNHFYFYKNIGLTKIVRENNGKENVIYHFLDIEDTAAKRILIEHKNIKLKIQLKGI